ncbi:hypothetical protein FYK55_18720 [Roseiconus nitratireducens]|uniref:Transcriptional regulatory protein ZraR n=1 Tax=Roseiconus nitratireducens TaxID=2605748 RepID=A0A5M6D0E4_9BACT|nr:helix-turn-helix domain-containing protein [Roseiconus nitratireducens]KAA5540947.1 hypothetical protein FYK55_18720 [Roseiconus nitratireducens]
MASSTKHRPFSRLIDRSTAPLWVIDPDGRLVFLSAAVGSWLDVSPESLVGRLCVAGSAVTDDPLDRLAASLSPPPGFQTRGTASLRIQPPGSESASPRPAALDTRFVRLGSGDQSVTVAIGGSFADQQSDSGVVSANELRQQLDSWRRHHETASQSALVGRSRSATRMRRQVQLAGSVRAHLLILSPPGCLAESIATAVHHRSSPGEPLVTVDGALMDPELLDASLSVVTHHLLDSGDANATAVLRGIDETPPDAQQRLAYWIDHFDNRLRLIAVSGPAPRITHVDPETDEGAADLLAADELPGGVDVALADLLCGFSINLYPLSRRVADIPLIAQAMLDKRRSSGDGSADRLSRAALDALVLYPWPDNLRELDQAVRQAMRACRGEVVQPDHLPLAVRSYRPNEGVPVSAQSVDLDATVARFEADLIRKTLDESDGNRAEAARRLNVSRARLLRKIESLLSDNSQ